jgi:hypothetical protein
MKPSMKKMKPTRVEILVIVVMILQGINYLFTNFGNPVKWGVNLSARQTLLENNFNKKCSIDSVYFMSNTADHATIKTDINLIKIAVLGKSLGTHRRNDF